MRRLALVALTGLAAAAVAVPALGRSNGPDPALARVGNAGVPIAAGARTADAIRWINGRKGYGLSGVSRLAVRGQSVFYTLDGAGTTGCYGVRTSLDPVDELRIPGLLACSPVFPSADRPLLSLSVVEGTVEHPDLRLIRARGIAADGVAAVELRDASGAMAATVPVVGNVWDFGELPPGELVEVVALDAGGNALYRESVRG